MPRHAELRLLQPIINMELVEVEREDPALVKVRAEAQDKLRLGREQLPPLPRPSCWTSSTATTLRTIPICLSRSNARSGTPTRASAVWTAGAAAGGAADVPDKLARPKRRAFFLTNASTAERSCSAHTPTPPRSVDKRCSPRLKDTPSLLDKRVDRKPPLR